MGNSEYLNLIVQKYDNNFQYTQNESTAFNNLKTMLQGYFNSNYNYYNSNVDLDVQKSGSRAKGTAIKGSSDMDMFISITDRYNEDQLKNYYDGIYDFLKSKNLQVRKQNVSIGVRYYNCDIDVVPAKKVNSSSYSKGYNRFNDHYLWSHKKQKRTLTNIQKHIDLVQNSGLQKEIMLTKIWRNKNDLDFPSIYIEIMVTDALKNIRTYDLEKDFLSVLRYIRDNILDKKVCDPSNGENVISDTITNNEKEKIKKQANYAIEAKYWSDVF